MISPPCPTLSLSPSKPFQHRETIQPEGGVRYVHLAGSLALPTFLFIIVNSSTV